MKLYILKKYCMSKVLFKNYYNYFYNSKIILSTFYNLKKILILSFETKTYCKSR